MKIMFNKQLIRIGFLSITAGVFLVACTDLEIKETDSIISDGGGEGFNGVENVDASITNVYNALRGHLESQDNFFALQEVSTDEMLVPTRGTDWGDNGIWRTLHQHTWTPSHQYVLTVWNQMNQNAFLATEIIDSRSNPSTEQKAEAQFLRAYAMYQVMDLYGQVPFREPDEGPEIEPTVLSRAEAFDFILADLNDAIAGLPSSAPNNANTNTATKEAAQFLKARLLLNKFVYVGAAGPETADMDEVISLVDAITNSGYQLQEGYFDIFKEDQDTETIWWMASGVGNRIWNGMHYNQISPDNTGGGWNGFSTLAEFYDLFEGDPNSNNIGDGQEERRGWVPDETNADETNLGIGYGFLIGQQYNVDGEPLQDRAKNPLIFTKELPGLVGNNERTGIRTIKYHPVNGGFTGHQIIFRYADAYLMKAEAMVWKGEDASAMVNTLRDLRKAQPLASVDAQAILDERGRELWVEFVRRTDMIRLGQFGRDWEFKDPTAVNDKTKELYPIPSNAILSNTNLVQNPGY
ncbi:RagB/SusD family nutrient uptake outer membrane protein [Lutimonas vermicola]|uniref:RagB/SusD family nutrient uptake outer membrane protein n=1 Tax=Lutimonas vermicola TaxID=414288 RepID=A0ABU9L150_9FLAO